MAWSDFSWRVHFGVEDEKHSPIVARDKSSHDLSRYGLIGERPAVAWTQGARFFRTGLNVGSDRDP